MAFNIYSSDDDNNVGNREGLLQSIREMIKRIDPRGSYHIEPTWRVNGVPISRCTSPELPFMSGARGPRPAPDAMKSRNRRRSYEYRPAPDRTSFGSFVGGLSIPELREVIMNACLKNLGSHRDVIAMLKVMQGRNPKPISGRIRNPNVGMYLYCRSQRELVEIVLELDRNDDTGCFRQDVRDLVTVMKENDGKRRYFS
ncbi:hypothetical protein GGR50DRAFT_693155 [Xylaria sp. CBS 124048]|nr:hypothetical protein GGR50DRAFT_693155 [Xylaria sp. CBS 124048]